MRRHAPAFEGWVLRIVHEEDQWRNNDEPDRHGSESGAAWKTSGNGSAVGGAGFMYGLHCVLLDAAAAGIVGGPAGLPPARGSHGHEPSRGEEFR
jgi:hypothetical protein